MQDRRQGDELVDPEVGEAPNLAASFSAHNAVACEESTRKEPLGPRHGLTEYSLGSQAPPM